MNLKHAVKRLLGDRLLGRLEYTLRPGLKGSWGGPFNGQQLRRKIYRGVLEELKPRAIVETGTFRATTTELFAESGIPVYTVEASPRYHTYAARRLRAHRERVKLHLGDSRTFLRHLAQDGTVPHRRVFFYLDAHWEEDLPLREEVEIIMENWTDAVIMVDDFEVPGTGYDFDDYGAGMALTLDYLAPLAPLGLQAFFPVGDEQAETGARRGCVLLARDPDAIAALERIETLRPAG